ncbi:CHAT domain-containing protein [Kitasatospora sp. NPDC057692]|uniref:CHAT domain-containing protein n=1 Tax=Kitasatospora sp. NPDC057692 TaxID=3346215 RepID=UPI0036B695D7
MTLGQNDLPEPELTEGGGLSGVRAWALDATGRAEALLLPDPAGPPRLRLDDPAAHDRMIGELAELEGLLGADEPIRPLLAARLGGLLAVRHLNRGEEPADRPRAQRLLREARACEVSLTGWEAHRTALYLATLLFPQPAPAPVGGQGGFAAVMAWQAENPAVLDPGGPVLAELRELLGDLRDAPLPPDLRLKLDTMASALGLAQGSAADFLAGIGPLIDGLPADFPGLQQVRMLMGFLDSVPIPPEQPAAPGPAAPPLDPEAEREDVDRMTAMALAMVDVAIPGSLAPEQLAEIARRVRAGRAHSTDGPADAAYDALTYAVATLVPAMQGRDHGMLADALGVMRQAADGLPPGDKWRGLLGAVDPALLVLSRFLGGNLEDEEEANRHFTEVLEELGDSSHPFALHVRIIVIGQRSAGFQRVEDRAGVLSCIEDLRVLREGLPGGHDALANALMMLGLVHYDLWQLTHETTALRTGMHHLQEALDLMEGSTGHGGLLEPLRLSLTAVRAFLDGDPEALRAHLDAQPSEQPPSLLAGAGRMLPGRALASHLQAGLTRSRDDQDRAVEELEAARRDAADGGTWQHATLLWALADAYRERDDAEAGDRAAAARAMVESFEVLTADVLLEVGAEHRLLRAREGASRAVEAARWAGAQGLAERAVTMLELGRSLVLQAAAASAEVPELLAARGHQELADAWRQAESARDRAADQPIPSLLRRRALDALRGGAGLFEPPTLAELNAGLRPGETDALVYLLPGTEGMPGMAIVLGPDLEPGVLGLPLLAEAGRAPLESFLDLSAERSRLRRAASEGAAAVEAVEAIEAPWEEALSDLCDWAWPAVVAPLLLGVAERLEANPDRHRERPGPPRIVLVPCGNLGAVPWHAARLPEEDRHRYACELMVLSYAASGREFLRAAARERLAPGARPVLVADPQMDLTRAELEVLALRDGYYPDAELYGEYYGLDGERVGPGTPEEMLALLPGSGARPPLSLLHIASHGEAGVRPTVSALSLADPGPTRPPVRAGLPGGAADPGMLTVTRLLDRPAEAGAGRGGPLVVLSACETDLSNRDHDEALTLATAFLASGAKDVVGSRWTTRDGASALMMAVFHHHVASAGLSPADALRAAQLWMLDPHREAPEGLGGELRREASQPGLDRLPLWAAFIHQGHPGAADAATTATTATAATATTAGPAGPAHTAERQEGTA